MTEESDSLFPATGSLPEPTEYVLPAWLTSAVPRTAPPCGETSGRQKPTRELTGAEIIYLMQRRALDLLEARQFSEALELFEQFLAIDPEDVTTLLLKGTCLLELGK